MTAKGCDSLKLPDSMLALLRAEVGVRRDDDYLRQLMLDLEASDDWLHDIGLFVGQGEDETRRYFHARLLADEGFLEETQDCVFRMTSKGHDFVAHTRDETTWRTVKETLAHLKAPSITMLGNVAEGYVRAKLREITGLDL